MRSHHTKTHGRTHGPSLLERCGLRAIVKVGRTEIGRYHFDSKAVTGAYFDDGGFLHMTVQFGDPLICPVPEGVDDGDWSVEVWSGDGWALLHTFHSDITISAGDNARVIGPLKFAVNPQTAKVLLRTHKDTDRSREPSDFYDDDDED